MQSLITNRICWRKGAYWLPLRYAAQKGYFASLRSLKEWLYFGVALIFFSTSSVLSAQDTPDLPPATMAIDPAGLDRLGGGLVATTPELAFPDSILRFSDTFLPNGWRHSLHYRYGDYRIQLGDKSFPFFIPSLTTPRGYIINNTSSGYTIYTSDGTQIVLDNDPNGYGWLDGVPGNGASAIASTVTAPNGEVLTFWYKKQPSGIAGFPETVALLESVVSNRGVEIKLTYACSNAVQCYTPIKATLINNAIEYCAPLSDVCQTSAYSWPSISFSISSGSSQPGNVTSTFNDVTDPSGSVSRYTLSSTSYGMTFAYRRPGSSSDTQWSTLNSDGTIHSVTRDGVNYVYSLQPQTYGITSTLSDGSTLSTTNAGCTWDNSDGCGSIGSITDGNGHTTSYTYDQYDRMSRMTKPDQGYIDYTYDGRGNVSSARTVARPGSGLADIVKAANYPVSCDNWKTCNHPTWTRDALGHQTDLTYDENSGGVLTKTLPADAFGIRAQTRYSYVQRYAWVKTAAGSYAQASSPIWVLNSESSCANSNATGNVTNPCSGNDEIVTAYDYGPNSGPNNLLLRGKAVSASGVTRRTCYGYDQLGNRISETKPLAGLGACP